MELTPIEHPILTSPNQFNSEIQNPDLILAKSSVSIGITRSKQEDADVIKKFSGQGEGGLSAITGTLSNFLLVVSLLSSTGAIAGPLLGMIKVFKLVYSLRLINVYFGNILEAFLSSLSEGFGNKALPGTKAEPYSVNTRGKLSLYNIGVITNDYLHIPYLMLILTRLLGVLTSHFKKKIKRAKMLSYSHLIIINVLDIFKTSIFYSSIYDIGIYTVHELLHHDLYIK